VRLNIDVTLTDSVEAHEALRTKGYDEHGNKFLDVKTGDDSFHEDAEWNNVTQIVDRRERQY
jgi:isocitrate dehydrogenase kinase/phosphatase